MNLDNSEVNQKEKISPLDEKAFMHSEFGESKYEAQDLGFYHWKIEDWKKLENKVYSPEVNIGGFKWRILLFPRGNNDNNSIALYLDCAPTDENDPNWSVCAQFILAIHSPSDDKVYVMNSVNHRFCSDEKDWGFTKFVEISKLIQPYEGQVPLIVNDKTNISVYIKVIKDPTGVLWHNFKNYDSKAATGYVGLRNQGATCYMNSLLQSLFFTNYFRKSVFQIPTDNDTPTNSVVYALQRVFYNLQTSDIPVGTTELTKSFGWDSLDSFMQHDVQEFNRVLQDNLENKMKGTAAEGAVQKLFVGKMKSFIKCINVNYESSRIEDYYDIQLNVKGCNDIKESFVDYCATETLEGENKYMAEGYGLQDATKGVIFESFPPVLHLQLKRFEYDIHADSMVKINDRHEFLPTIDLAPFLSDDADKSESYEYELHGVLVHSGDLNGGHYFAFIKPSANSDWLKFDDDRVTKATLTEVYDDNFGGADDNRMDITPMHRGNMNQHHSSRFTNAYMLVYIRKSMLNDILGEVTPDQIPSHIAGKIQEERAALEARKREREELQTMFSIKVVTDDIVSKHEGYDLVDFNERNPDVPRIHQFKLLKTDTVGKLVQFLSEHYKISPSHFRLWMFAFRENSTIRPDIFIPEDDYSLTLENLKDKSTNRWPDLRFYLQFSGQKTSIEQKFPKLDTNSSNYNIIFCKFFDPKTNTARYIGHELVKSNSKTVDLIPVLNARMNFPPETQLRFFEELQPGKIQPINLRLSFHQCEIRSGDIICFHTENYANGDGNQLDQSRALLNFFDSLSQQIHVLFKHKPNPNVQLDDHHFKLSRQSKYSNFSKLLADKIGTDPLKLRFYSTTGSNASSLTPVVYNPDTVLQEIIHAPTAPNVALYTVYYELLDVEITQIELQRYINVVWVNESVKDAAPQKIMVRRDGYVSQIVDALNNIVQPNNPLPKAIRLYIGFHSRFQDYIDSESLVSTISDSSTIYAEFIPDQILENSNELLTVPVFQFHKETHRSHGTPFLLDLAKGTTLESLNEMIQHKLGLTNKEYEKARLFLMINQGSRPIPLETEEDWELASLGSKSVIGVDIIDRNAKPSRFADRAIKIFN